MAQLRFNNWQDFRYSDVNNRKDMGSLPDGLWRGFDYDVSSSGTNLVLSHTATGYSETLIDGTAHAGVGMVKTKQGVIVTEDAAITIVVTNNAGAGNPKRDLVVMQHTYVETVGGVSAGYTTVNGTPAPSPTDPIPPFPLTTVILGYLYWPAGATLLSDATYTKAKQPVAGGGEAGGSEYVLKSVAQVITGRKQLTHQTAIQASIAVTGSTLLSNAESNHYLLANVNASYIPIDTLSTPYAGGLDYLTISPDQKLLLIPGGNISLPGSIPVHIERGATVEFYCLSGTYYLIRGAEVMTNIPTKMLTGMVGNKQIATFAANQVTLNGRANYYQLDIDMSGTPIINNITGTSAMWDQANAVTKGGNFVVMRFNNTGAPGQCVLTDSGSISGAFKPLLLSDVGTSGTYVQDGGYAILVENELFWGVVAVFDSHLSVQKFYASITNLNTEVAALQAATAMPAWVNITPNATWSAGSIPPQYRVDGTGRVYLRGYLVKGSGGSFDAAILPVIARSPTDLSVPCCVYNPGLGLGLLFITSAGVIETNAFVTGDITCLDGITYLNS